MFKEICAKLQCLPIIIITTGILALAGISCRLEPEPRLPESQSDSGRVPDQESWNSTLITSNMGKKSAQIRFGHMQRFNESQEYQFDQKIHVDFFDEAGNRTSWLKSEKGKFNELRKVMQASGNVVAYSDSADLTLLTETLYWDENSGKIISNDKVKLATDHDTLYGLGFESETDLSEWIIKQPRGHTSRPIEVIPDRERN